MPFALRPASSASDLAVARKLFREYADELGIDLSFQRFEEELATLPGRYAPPAGCLLLAFDDSAPIGCVAVRLLEPAICEMKRLYLRPAARGRGVGRVLATAALDTARLAGHTTMRLDTLRSMHAANALYVELGFREVAAYYANPHLLAVYYELRL